jgi:ArsR family transcriptional regulator, arsenate/arsenite/antimonite-responsive transcriptional repressor
MADNNSGIADFFKALGDSTRIRILQLLLSHKKLCVGFIAYKLGITQSAVSQHLKVLKNSKIVEGERKGSSIHYRIREDTLKEYGIELAKIIKK